MSPLPSYHSSSVVSQRCMGVRDLSLQMGPLATCLQEGLDQGVPLPLALEDLNLGGSPQSGIPSHMKGMECEVLGFSLFL